MSDETQVQGDTYQQKAGAALPRIRLGSRTARNTREVDLTEKYVTDMPIGKHDHQLIYDLGSHGLAVSKVNRRAGVTVLYRSVLTTVQTRAAGKGDHGGYIPIGRNISLADARARNDDIQKVLAAAEKLYTEKGIVSELDGFGQERMKNRDRPYKAKTVERFINQPGYQGLMEVLMEAYGRATSGKGKERHEGEHPDFEKQDMMQVMDDFGPDFCFGQVRKKMIESKRMRKSAARNELLDAIVYLAGAIIWNEKQ